MAEIVGMWPGIGQRMSSGGTAAIKGGQMRELGEANRWPVFGQTVSDYSRTWPLAKDVAKGLPEGVRRQ
jgi:hypothetical protein